MNKTNNNALVFDTFDKAIASNPNAHPLCHSDRGFQYTNRTFLNKRLQRNLGVLTPLEKHD